MTVNSVSSNSNAVAPAQARETQASRPVEKSAEKATALVQAPKQPEPIVNTSGQKIGGTISTSA